MKSIITKLSIFKSINRVVWAQQKNEPQEVVPRAQHEDLTEFVHKKSHFEESKTIKRQTPLEENIKQSAQNYLMCTTVNISTA